MANAHAIRGPLSSLEDFRLMAGCRALQLRNLVDVQLRDSPWRTLAIIGLLIGIWAALYTLLDHVLGQVRNWGLVGLVADQHVFLHFFLVLAVMLAFSNGVLAFGALYGRDESSYLLAMPIHARAVVCVKWIESLFLSSWSFLLLGVPLMLAVAHNSNVEWYYYPLFLAHFVGFVAIPACVGLLAAWAVAMWAPRRPLGVAISLGALLILGAIYWASSMSGGAVDSEEWLRTIFRHIGVVKQPLLPHTWTARGIVAAINHRVEDSLFYLLVVFGNGAFLSWLTINVIARTWPEAYSRAQQGRFHPTIRRAWFTRTICLVLFFYLPFKLREVMLKDLKAFARDARQWSQMLIMFGLLVIYVLNLTRLPVDLNTPGNKALVAFLNLTTVSLILATFTSRFVYPLLSLESQQLWLLELLPIRRTTLLLVKFLFAATVSILSAGSVMWLAISVVELPPLWAEINIAVCLSICVGLSGLSIGIGARFPVLGDRNPARIASGFGGTVNLIASMIFVAIEMIGVAAIGARALGVDAPSLPGVLGMELRAMVVVLVMLGPVVAAIALIVGARHFRQLEG